MEYKIFNTNLILTEGKIVDIVDSTNDRKLLVYKTDTIPDSLCMFISNKDVERIQPKAGDNLLIYRIDEDKLPYITHMSLIKVLINDKVLYDYTESDIIKIYAKLQLRKMQYKYTSYKNHIKYLDDDLSQIHHVLKAYFHEVYRPSHTLDELIDNEANEIFTMKEATRIVKYCLESRITPYMFKYDLTHRSDIDRFSEANLDANLHDDDSLMKSIMYAGMVYNKIKGTRYRISYIEKTITNNKDKDLIFIKMVNIHTCYQLSWYLRVISNIVSEDILNQLEVHKDISVIHPNDNLDEVVEMYYDNKVIFVPSTYSLISNI